MIEPKQLKIMGLKFARVLQIAVRTSGMLSPEHSVAAAPILESYTLLNSILKEQSTFTFGFSQERILLDNVLTEARGLDQLEDDFLKRGISALRFEAGLSLARYKAVLAMLAMPLKKIQEIGGTDVFLARQAIEGVRIFPAGRSQRRSPGGDTVLDMDVETYLRTQDNQEEAARFPAMMPAAAALFDASSGPDAILARVTPMVEAALSGKQGEPEQAYISVAQMLKGVRPDMVLGAFPAARQAELQSLPPEEVAAELMQSSAMQWAARQLSSAPRAGDAALLVEERVVYALARSLHATQMAQKLAGRLAKFFQEYSFPTHVVEKVQTELNWIALPPEVKHKRLLAIERFQRTDFTHLLEHIRDLMKKAYAPEATEVALHYLKFLERPPDDIELQELSRLPELIAAMAEVRTGFCGAASDKLLEVLQRDVFDSFRHMQVVNALAALSKMAATYEDYEIVQNIGSAMEQLLADNRERHAACCGKMLSHLLPASSFERVVEQYLEKRADAAFARKTAAMIHRAGAPFVEFLFQRLENEEGGQNRMAIIRLIARMGPAGIATVRQRLGDSRWYVVRNACVLLGDLADPEMAIHMAPVLRNAGDIRVQRAAAAALIKTRAAGRAQALAAALPFLLGEVLEQALDEIVFLKDPETVGDIEKFLRSDSPGRTANLARAVQALAGIGSDRAAAVLARVATDRKLPRAARKIAVDTLLRKGTPGARTALVNFTQSFPDDPLSADIRRGIAAGAASGV